MRFIFHYPDAHGTEVDLLDSGRLDAVAQAAEKSGWSGFALTEHPVPGANWLERGGHQTLDPFVGLAHVSAVTSRLRLLTYLAVVPYRNPFLLAKAAATLDRLSGGRLDLGVGTGYLKSEYFALGVDFEERNALFDEALDVLPLHWKGETFSYQGRHFAARDVIARPRPTQNPIPIWIGGNSRLTLRRVAERAQGWMPMSGPPELSKTARTAHIATLDDLRAKIGELRSLAGDRADVIDITSAYPDPSIVTDPTRDVERHREIVGTLAEIGVTNVTVAGPLGSETKTLEFVQAFGETYA